MNSLQVFFKVKRNSRCLLGQFAKGLVHADDALLKIEESEMDLECAENDYANLGKFLKTLEDFRTYIENNQGLIPNYGETISTAFVESTINQVVAKRSLSVFVFTLHGRQR